MLPDLLLPFADEYKILNLFRYITFRSGGAFMTALLVSLFFGERFIAWLKPIRQKDSLSVWMGQKAIFWQRLNANRGRLANFIQLYIRNPLWVPLSILIYGRYCW